MAFSSVTRANAGDAEVVRLTTYTATRCANAGAPSTVSKLGHSGRGHGISPDPWACYELRRIVLLHLDARSRPR